MTPVKHVRVVPEQNHWSAFHELCENYDYVHWERLPNGKIRLEAQNERVGAGTGEPSRL